MSALLDRVNGPQDIKNMSQAELLQLCDELRCNIISVVSRNGGHLAPNLGVIELTVALHRVFNSPEDKIIWDVGHQSYSHKILTGRFKRFPTIRQYGGLSGFQQPVESEHDAFVTGHAGVALSSAMGLAAANEAEGRKDAKVVAVVGDGALGNGVSLEALNNIRELKRNLILVINDNKMSISKSVGTISTHLTRIITGRGYNHFKSYVKYVLRKLPFGSAVIHFISRVEELTKHLLVSSVFFEEMGFKYVGPIDGHDLPSLISHFEKIREITARPIAVHVITEKGHGCKYAISSPEKFHGVPAFDPVTGELKVGPKSTYSFSAAFGNSLIALAEKHPEVVALTAAMSSGTGLSKFAKQFRDRFYDVGIAEEHCVAFAGGLAAGGLRPVVAIYSTFLQRALDCVFHDICLQNRPVIFGVDRAGAVEDGPTHHGIYDLPFLLGMPGLAILCPRDAAELRGMLFAAYERSAPVMLRYPRSDASDIEVSRAPLVWGKAEVVAEGTEVSIWSNGRELLTALASAALLRAKGVSAAVVNTRFLKPFDSELLLHEAENKLLVTIEDSQHSGGLGRIVNDLLVGNPNKGVLHFSWPKGILPHGSVRILRENNGMLPESIASAVLKKLGRDA